MGIFMDNKYIHSYELFEKNSNILLNMITDDYLILEKVYYKEPITLTESFKDIISNIWTKILQLFNNIKTFFDNLILNVNYIKKAKLPKQQNDDLIKILQELEPRTITGCIEIVNKFIQTIDLDKNPNVSIPSKDINRDFGDSDSTFLEYEIDKSSIEINNCLNTIKRLPELTRIESENYDYKNLQSIPLNKMISDCKDSRKNCTEFRNKLLIIERNDKFKNEKYKNIFDKMINFCKLNIEYYQLRIRILFSYFKSARISLSKINNIGIELKTSTSMNPCTPFTIEDSIDNINNILSIRDKMYVLNENKQFREYNKFHSILCDKLNIPKNSIITFKISFNYLKDKGVIKGRFYIDNEESIPVTGKPLYVYRSIKIDIDKLEPVCIGNAGGTFYPTPRIYVHISIPLDKTGKQIGYNNIASIQNSINTISLNSFIVYEIMEDIDYVYKDPEMGGTGAYIMTSKPVKVKEFDYKKFVKDNNFY